MSSLLGQVTITVAPAPDERINLYRRALGLPGEGVELDLPPYVTSFWVEPTAFSDSELELLRGLVVEDAETSENVARSGTNG